MKISRRHFIQAGAGTAIAVAAGGCDRAESPLSRLLNPLPRFSGSFKVPGGAAIDPVVHAINRLSFGARPGDYARICGMGATKEEAAQAWIEEQLHPERIDDTEAERVYRRLEELDFAKDGLFEMKAEVLMRELVHGTVLRAVYSKRQLFEVMVHFWTDHFNIAVTKRDCQWLKAWDDREVIRKFALGPAIPEAAAGLSGAMREFFTGSPATPAPTGSKFRDMLRASALSPAMLWYLDGRDNRTDGRDSKPNENYARELLELHTLGVHGGYTQKDIMEIARCLSGWTVWSRRQGLFRGGAGAVSFQPGRHDNGPKEVLGHIIPAGLGEKDIDRVLDIVALHPATCRHIATKLCRRFISDAPPEQAITTVVAAFKQSDGDIRDTLRALFATEAFRTSTGVRFKRPFHFLVSALRATNAAVRVQFNAANDEGLMTFLVQTGHTPFHYPTPDGYPEDPGHWMGTLLWRWKFAQELERGSFGVSPDALAAQAGGDTALMAHLLGRAPDAREIAEFHESGQGLALCLSGPAFQMF